MPSPTIILVILLGLSSLGNVLLGKLYVEAREDYAAEKQAFSSFVAGVKTTGDAQNKKAAEQKAKDEKLKKEADAENAKTIANLTNTIAGLRKRNNESASSSRLPPAPPGSNRPDLACFDRIEYQRADGELMARILKGTRELADEGTKNTVDLNTAKKWAQAP